MSSTLTPLFSKASDLWGTPAAVFQHYHTRYAFTIDAAANAQMTLLPRWWGPDSRLSTDALAVSWAGETCWLNPPYSRVKDFTRKARLEQLEQRVTTVMLIPSRTDTAYWHDYIWNTAAHTWQHGIQGQFLRGRLKFRDARGTSMNPAPFPSVVIVFDGATV